MEPMASWVEFDIRPGMLPAFLDAARLDAGRTARNEAGNCRYGILQDPALPNRVCFHEVGGDDDALVAPGEVPQFMTYLATTESTIGARKAAGPNVAQHGKA